MLQTLYFPKSYPLIFVSNAKVACSSIKKSIWISSSPNTYDETTNPHDRVKGPFDNNIYAAAKRHDDLSMLTKFGFVRNPYSRFISAYKDKISRPKPDPHVWKILSDRYSFKLAQRPSPEDVLNCILNDDAHYVDQHFAKQKINLSIGIINFDYIGQIERPNVISDYLAQYNIKLHSHQKHATKAADVTDIKKEIGENAIKLIQEIYKDDFLEFGYDFSPENIYPISEPKLDNVDERIMQTTLKLVTSNNIQESKRLVADLSTMTNILDTAQILSEKFELT